MYNNVSFCKNASVKVQVWLNNFRDLNFVTFLNFPWQHVSCIEHYLWLINIIWWINKLVNSSAVCWALQEFFSPSLQLWGPVTVFAGFLWGHTTWMDSHPRRASSPGWGVMLSLQTFTVWGECLSLATLPALGCAGGSVTQRSSARTPQECWHWCSACTAPGWVCHSLQGLLVW